MSSVVAVHQEQFSFSASTIINMHAPRPGLLFGFHGTYVFSRSTDLLPLLGIKICFSPALVTLIYSPFQPPARLIDKII